ncbi:acetyl-CoA hydrolase/transferase family protein, partial [Lacrimispora sp.]
GRGKMVVTFMMGTRRLYDFVHDNPAICMMPVSYVNDPFVISQNDNVVSINSALQIDLMGQVCAEAIGLKQYSAVGGQMDFVRGASASKGGRSIIAFGATTKGGTISKIVPFLAEGAAVTTSRNDVDYIVTEYGIAHLKGKCLRERARELIKIAAPAFREELSGEFEKRFGEVLLV